MLSTDLSTARILIVDDEADNIALLEGCLLDFGFSEILSTMHSSEAMQLVEDFRPDLILLDLHMPPPDGFELLAQIRERTARVEYLPVLVLTADVTEGTKQRALSNGARDFLTKPFDLSEVALRIGNLLETRSLYREQSHARKKAEVSQRRALALASASHVLSTSLDYHTTLAMLCRSLVPEVADYCVVDVLREDGTVEREGFAHADPAKERLLEVPLYRDPGILPTQHPILAALRDGRSTLVAEIEPGMADGVAANDEDRKLLAQLEPRSLVVAPITAPGVTYGALILVQSESGRIYDKDDLEFGIDLARRAAITLENAQLLNRAQEATRARDEMLGVVAHDLRNPLSTITMGASMLMDTASTESGRRHAELVGRAADRMQRMIEDLLEVRRMEAGKLSVQIQMEDVSSVVGEAVAMLTPIAEAREIRLLSELPDDTPRIALDAARIQQVLSNLVGNAVKFTPAGGTITIAIRNDDTHTKFCVSDTGPGIPRDQLPHIFGRFWQAKAGDNRGIGLGLSIVKGIVEAHGGSVWVESDVGAGATFYFTLPHSPPAQESDPLAEMSAEQPTSEPETISIAGTGK